MALLDPILQWNKKFEFSDYPVVAQVISRGRVISTVQASPKIWQFKLTIETPHLQWQNYKGFLEDLRAINMSQPFDFTVANTPSLQFLISYSGTLTATEQMAVTVASPQAGDTQIQLRLTNLPLNRQNIFFKGDYVQAVGDTKPYTVTANANSDGSGNALITLNRPLFTQPTTGSKLLFGANVTWQCFMTSLPQPSATSQYIYGISWSGDFEFSETA